MKHITTFEQFINESAESAKDHEMAVKLVAKLIKENPEKFKHLKTDLPNNYGTQDVDDATNESEVNETLAAASADKLINHEPLTPKVNATLISNARNGVLKMMREPDGKTHFWDPKTKEYVAKTITYNGKGEYLYSDAIDKDGNLK